VPPGECGEALFILIFLVLYLSRAAISGLGLATFSHSQKKLFQDSGGLYLKSAILALLSGQLILNKVIC
jgi:hypothetical protein